MPCDVSLRAERSAQIGTPGARAGAVQRSIEQCRANTLRGECADGQNRCLGGERCFHSVARRSLAADAMLASLYYDYGISPQRRAALRERITNNLLARKVPLSIVLECGVDAPLLAFAGISVQQLVESSKYALEDVVETLRLDWPMLRALQFTPWLLRRPAQFPLIVLYDKLRFTRFHIYEFASIDAASARLILADPRCALLLGVDFDRWGQ